jgi:hypothetical protein
LADGDELARQVIDLAKASVLADNHFLSAAIGRLQLAPMSLDAPFATDGYFLAFDATHLLSRFKHTGKPPKRNLVHTVAHCLFLHPYVSAAVDQPLWNLACDIAAERIVTELLGTAPGTRGTHRALAIERIERDLGGRATAEKVYRHLREGWWSDCAGEWMSLMKSDDHSLWYAPTSADGAAGGEGAGEGTDPSGGVGTREGFADSTQVAEGVLGPDDRGRQTEAPSPEGGRAGSGTDGTPGEKNGSNASTASGNARRGPALQGSGTQDASGRGRAAPRSAARQGAPSAGPTGGDATFDHAAVQGEGATQHRARGRGEGAGTADDLAAPAESLGIRRTVQPPRERQVADWRQVAISLAVNLQTMSAKRGGGQRGALAEELEAAAAPRTSYADFLRAFATPGEVMRISDDEFDYNFYTYGLQLYGDLPLVEPLEYREERRVREFVVVIDTSGSVRGDIVRSFVATTFGILRETESFFERVNLRILQCDAQVRTDDHITSLTELDSWMRQMRVLGGGGTDFRPAFEYVDDLMAERAFAELGGLVYFTDGWGTYPDWIPPYRTAFAFYDEDHRAEDVPPWAMQIVLDGDIAKHSIARGADDILETRKEHIRS